MRQIALSQVIRRDCNTRDTHRLKFKIIHKNNKDKSSDNTVRSRKTSIKWRSIIIWHRSRSKCIWRWLRNRRMHTGRSSGGNMRIVKKVRRRNNSRFIRLKFWSTKRSWESSRNFRTMRFSTRDQKIRLEISLSDLKFDKSKQNLSFKILYILKLKSSFFLLIYQLCVHVQLYILRVIFRYWHVGQISPKNYLYSNLELAIVHLGITVFFRLRYGLLRN